MHACMHACMNACIYTYIYRFWGQNVSKRSKKWDKKRAKTEPKGTQNRAAVRQTRQSLQKTPGCKQGTPPKDIIWSRNVDQKGCKNRAENRERKEEGHGRLAKSKMVFSCTREFRFQELPKVDFWWFWGEKRYQMRDTNRLFFEWLFDWGKKWKKEAATRRYHPGPGPRGRG